MNHGKNLAPKPVLLFLLFLADYPSKLWRLRINRCSDTDANEIRIISCCRWGREFCFYRTDMVTTFKSEKKLPHCEMIAIETNSFFIKKTSYLL